LGKLVRLVGLIVKKRGLLCAEEKGIIFFQYIEHCSPNNIFSSQKTQLLRDKAVKT
jgi:hypothetical protein